MRKGQFILQRLWTYAPQELGVGTLFQTYKGRVALRGDVVKDDAGSFAVFTEQGSSASQMTA